MRKPVPYRMDTADYTRGTPPEGLPGLGYDAREMRSCIAVTIIALALGLSSPPARGADAADDLVDAQRQLVESTRAYRETLDQLLIFQEQVASRAAQEAAKRRSLLEEGIVSRREVQDSERVAAAAMSRVKETLERRAEADALLAETLASIELARVPRPPAADIVSTPSALRYDGAAELTSSLASGLERFFAQRFARPLPVSARGQTPVHDRLGLDHRDAIDVAVHPDSEEGRALIEYLRVRGIPFLAFRGAVFGSSTGAHVHVGWASIRLMPVRR